MIVLDGLGRDIDVLAPLANDGLGRQPLEAEGHWQYIGSGGVAVGGSADTIGPLVTAARPSGGSGSRRPVRRRRAQPVPLIFSYVGLGGVEVGGEASVTYSRVHRGYGQVIVSGSATTVIDRSKSIALAIDDDFLLMAA